MRVPVEIGQRVGGKYEVERVLGSGGAGVVLKARHVRLGEPCAIKLMLPEVLEAPMARERFFREARACAKLKSDHVVRIFDVAELDDGTPYMVLEYLEGVDLRAHTERGRLPVGEAARIVLQICAALAEAHSLGIVHRDIKPENVFLACRDGTTRVKLLDFGLSKLVGDAAGANQALTAEGAIAGTPGFMAPEQLRGGPVDARTDVWAVGVLLYGLLSGAFPFEDKPPYQVLVGVEPPPPSRCVPGIPPELDRIVLRCLAKDAAERPRGVEEIAAAVAPFADEDGPRISIHVEHGAGGRPRSRWKVPAALSGLFIAAGAGIALAPRSPQAPPAPPGTITAEARLAAVFAAPEHIAVDAGPPNAPARRQPASSAPLTGSAAPNLAPLTGSAAPNLAPLTGSAAPNLAPLTGSAAPSPAPAASVAPLSPAAPLPTSPHRAAGFDLRDRL
jgi:serine/threonine-protein kinase